MSNWQNPMVLGVTTMTSGLQQTPSLATVTIPALIEGVNIILWTEHSWIFLPPKDWTALLLLYVNLNLWRNDKTDIHDCLLTWILQWNGWNCVCCVVSITLGENVHVCMCTLCTLRQVQNGKYVNISSGFTYLTTTSLLRTGQRQTSMFELSNGRVSKYCHYSGITFG